MSIENKKSVSGAIRTKLIGIVLLLMVLAVLNFFKLFVDNSYLHQGLQIVNDNILLIFLIAAFLLIGEIFNTLTFPFILPGPIFNALGAVLIVALIFRIFTLADSITEEDISQILDPLSILVYPLVFIIVLLIDYIGIFARIFEKRKTEPSKAPNKEKSPDQSESATQNLSEGKTWQDIGSEFRKTIYDLLRLIRSSINKKRDKGS
jgi:hypothetical protein